MTQTKSLLREPCYYLQQKGTLLLRRCSWKKNAKSLPSGAICPFRQKRKSTDYKPAEHNPWWYKVHFEGFFFSFFFFFFLFSQGNFSVSHTWSARPTTGASKISCLVVLFWQLSRQENLHGSSMSHAMTASPKHPSRRHEFWATPWLAEEILDRQTQRVDIPAHARTAHKGLLQKRLE